MFDGKTYNPVRDGIRLKMQLGRTWAVMMDGKWRTLEQVARETTALRTDNGHDSEAAISARLRDFRKTKFGGHELISTNAGGGHWLYQLIPVIPSEMKNEI